MTEVTILVGLPGSGKSYLGKAMAATKGISFFDDVATQIATWDLASKDISLGLDCILADPKLCDVKTLSSLRKQIYEIDEEISIEYIFFENEPEVCVLNVETRQDERIVSEEFIRHLSENYGPPFGLTRPCYRKEDVDYSE